MNCFIGPPNDRERIGLVYNDVFELCQFGFKEYNFGHDPAEKHGYTGWGEIGGPS